MSSEARFLIDENLPPRLKSHLADLFPGSVHVGDVNLARSTDSAIWEYATKSGFSILTKDRDFTLRARWQKKGPPTVVQVRVGNCSVSKLTSLIRLAAPEIIAAVLADEALYEVGFVQEAAASEATES